MQAVLLAALAAAFAVPSEAFHIADALPRHARGGRLHKQLREQQQSELVQLRSKLNLPSNWNPNVTVETIRQPVDHFIPGGASWFNQRFWWDTTFCGSNCFDASTPILCEVTGEWTASGAPGGAIAELAQRLNALLCTLEHRNYGESLVAPLSNKPAVTGSLSVQQAIEDFASFVPYFEAFLGNNGNAPSTKNLPANNSAYSPSHRWVIIGGSYAGALVSWINVKYSNLLTATWASSGVVQAIFDFTAFDQTVAAALGSDCSNAVRAVTAAFETYWSDATYGPAMRRLFGIPAWDDAFLTQQDFAWMLADAAAMAPQYGAKSTLCSYLNSTARDTPNSPAPNAPTGVYPTGWAALQAFAAFANFHYGPNFGYQCYYSTKCLSNQNYSGNWTDSTTWVWQCCSELAYWQSAPAGYSLRSSLLNTSYWTAQCNSAYGIGSAAGPVATFNAAFGGATPKVGNAHVFATQGSDDPWQPAGVQATLSSTYQEATAVCAGCSHCRDLHLSSASDPAPLAAVRSQVMNQIATWVNTAPHPLSPGAIAGIVVGGLAVLAVAALVARCVRRRRMQRQELVVAQQAVVVGYYPQQTAGYAQLPTGATY